MVPSTFITHSLQPQTDQINQNGNSKHWGKKSLTNEWMKNPHNIRVTPNIKIASVRSLPLKHYCPPAKNDCKSYPTQTPTKNNYRNDPTQTPTKTSYKMYPPLTNQPHRPIPVAPTITLFYSHYDPDLRMTGFASKHNCVLCMQAISLTKTGFLFISQLILFTLSM